MSFIDPPSSSRSTSCSTPAAAWAGSSRRSSSSGSPAGRRGCASTIDGTFPNHEANPLIEENRRDIVERVVAEKADIGIAWDGDADRCFFIDGTGEFIAGRLHHGAARRSVPAEAPGRDDHLRPARQLRGQGHRRAVRRHGADEPRRPRVLQAAHARGERDLRRRGHRALLLPRQLLRRQRLHPGAAHPRADVAEGADARSELLAPLPREVLHLGRDQHQAGEHGRSRARSSTGLAAQLRGRPPSTSSTACRSSTPTGTSTSGRRTPSRCCA